jgi:ribosome-associated translation inhibitor RaiA
MNSNYRMKNEPPKTRKFDVVKNTKKEITPMLAAFKTFTADRLDLDELVSLSAYGKALRAEYEAHQVEVPDYVSTQLNALSREIKGRVSDQLESRRKHIKTQLEGLKTPAERRTELQAELQKLDSTLVSA